jgi:hypothetical protein
LTLAEFAELVLGIRPAPHVAILLERIQANPNARWVFSVPPRRFRSSTPNVQNLKRGAS